MAALLVCGLVGLPLLTGAAVDQPETGQALYRAGCASCHGADGRGAPASLVGFDVPLPDFTDCSFVSREPQADWVIVAAEGGPVRGFAELMPAFKGVLSGEQLALIVKYVAGFCTNDDWPRGELNLPKALVTEKAYPEDEIVLVSTVGEGVDSITNKIIFEKRFGARNQIEIVVPFGWQKSGVDNGDWSSGIGDLAVGIKRALCHSAERGSIFSVTAEVILPTGDEDNGFGKGVTIFEPFVTYGKILPADFFFQSQAGIELPSDRDKAENEAFVRLNLGRSFAYRDVGRTWSPMIGVLAARELVSGEEINWDLVPQIQVTLNTRQHIRFNIGVRSPLNNSSHRDTKVMLYLLWDWFDGGLFEGW
jgi:mono/diheme cytochrome c family protein